MAFPLKTIIIVVLGNPNAQSQTEYVTVICHASRCEANTLMQMKEFCGTLMPYS